MAKLIYIANVTLDGFIEDASGSFDFTDPDEEDERRFAGGVVYLRHRNPT